MRSMPHRRVGQLFELPALRWPQQRAHHEALWARLFSREFGHQEQARMGNYDADTTCRCRLPSSHGVPGGDIEYMHLKYVVCGILFASG